MRILFCSDSFPGRFGALATAFAAQGHEVLFASHYGRRDFAIPGVRRVLLKPVREKTPLKRMLVAAKQAHSAFLSLRASGFEPDAVLFSASSATPLWIHLAFPSARLFGYADTPPLLTSGDVQDISRQPESEDEQAALFRLAVLARCHAVFAFSEQCFSALPPLLQRVAKTLPAFTDTEFFSPEAARPFPCCGHSFPMAGELVSMDVRPLRREEALPPRAVWELALGLLAHRSHCHVLLNCASAEVKAASEDFASRLPEQWRARLAVQGYRSLDGWRDMLNASTLYVLPEPSLSSGGVPVPEALEAMSCGTPVLSPALPGFAKAESVPGLLALPSGSLEETFSLLCRHLDIIRHAPAWKQNIRVHIQETYSCEQHLPLHMEEVMSVCRLTKRG